MKYPLKYNVPIILGTARRGRHSGKVGHYLADYIARTPPYSEQMTSEILDVAKYDFPILEERLAYRDDPPPGLMEFSRKISEADGILIVTPEYNHGYPGALKNMLDYLYPEYERKPFGIVTVSSGGFGGVNCLQQLRIVVLTLNAIPIPESVAVSRVHDVFDDQGKLLKPKLDRRFNDLLDDLLWYVEAFVRQKKRLEEKGAA